MVPTGLKPIEWCAGLFEGEGCLSHYSNGIWSMEMRMTDYDTMYDFYEAIGKVGSLSKLKKYASAKEHHKPNCHWRTTNKDIIYELVMLFYNHLGLRRQEKCREFLSEYLTK